MESNPKFQSKFAGFLGGLVLLGVVGFGDYITGYQLTFILFYLLPIIYVLRRTGQRAAFFIALLSVVVWWLSDYASGEHYTGNLIPIWNMGIRLAVFVLIIVLASHREELKKLVAERTAKLEAEIQERFRLEKDLLESTEREQRKIGHDLHDSLGQHLTATAMAAKLLARKLAEKSVPEQAMAGQLVGLVEEGIELTRKLARSLHPIELETDGLPGAFKNLAASLSRAFNVECEFQYSGGPAGPHDSEVDINLYRIAQEAVSNAIRHGRAHKIIISLSTTAHGNFLLSVVDDGSGFSDPAGAKKGMGLRIMKYRAGLIGASFDIQQLPSGGTRALCVLNPSPPAAEIYANEN